MTRFAWLTDIHLNFVDERRLEEFVGQVLDEDPDVVLLGGDIAEARDVASYLMLLDRKWQRKIYFVLGNHDFYFGSIGEVRLKMTELCTEHSGLCYLTQSPIVALSERVGLIGHDGWADGRAGDYENSTVMLSDYALIAELVDVGKQGRWELLKEMGDAVADWVRDTLPGALESFDHIYFLTHVPPLREACWHEGRMSDDDWAPHFSSLAVGDALLEIMPDYPEKKLTVLCGHTHGEGEVHPLDNLHIITGPAEYGEPGITRVLTVD